MCGRLMSLAQETQSMRETPAQRGRVNRYAIGYQLPTIEHKMTIYNYTRRSNKIQGNTYFHRLEVYENIFHMSCNNKIQGNTYFHRLEVYETIFHMSCNNKIQGNTYFHRLEVYETTFHLSCNIWLYFRRSRNQGHIHTEQLMQSLLHCLPERYGYHSQDHQQQNSHQLKYNIQLWPS